MNTTKKEVVAFIKQHGCTAHYSGNTRTMFITGKDAERVELLTVKQFGASIVLGNSSMAIKTANQSHHFDYERPRNKFAKSRLHAQFVRP